MRPSFTALSVIATLTLGASAEAVADDEALAPAMHAIDVEEHLGEVIDGDLTFKDRNGQEVQLSDYFDGDRPVLLTLNYYRCPVLCNVQLNALTDTLGALDWTAGDEHFQIVTVSIDPEEGPEVAKAKRASHLKALDRGDDVGWAFLTGDALSIKLLAAQTGVGYAYDAEQDQYAHPAVIMFLAPDGKIVRYVYGLTYDPKDVKFGLLEASEGRVGDTIDRLILSCFHYDATLGRYGPFAFGLMRLGGVFTIFIMGIGLLWFRRREKRLGGVKRAMHAEAPT